MLIYIKKSNTHNKQTVGDFSVTMINSLLGRSFKRILSKKGIQKMFELVKVNQAII